MKPLPVFFFYDHSRNKLHFDSIPLELATFMMVDLGGGGDLAENVGNNFNPCNFQFTGQPECNIKILQHFAPVCLNYHKGTSNSRKNKNSHRKILL